MRFRYLVTYDICDPKRLSRVFKMLRGYGDHVQYSLFLCDLSKKDQIILKGKLDKLVHHEEDQILFLNLGNVDRNWKMICEALGRPYQLKDDIVVFV